MPEAKTIKVVSPEDEENKCTFHKCNNSTRMDETDAFYVQKKENIYKSTKVQVGIED